MKNPRRLAALAALCVTVALAGWVAAGLAGLDSPSIESAGAPIEVSRATSATARAEHVDAPQATAPSTPDPVRKEAKEATGSVEVADGEAAAPLCRDPPTVPRPAAGAVLLAAVSPTDPVQTGAKPPLELRCSRCVPRAGRLHRSIPLVALRADAEGRHRQAGRADQGEGQDQGARRGPSSRL